jgi:acyl-CoA thioesterase
MDEVMGEVMGEVTAASAAMQGRDNAANGLRIEIERAAAGEATASMTVTEAMTNGLGTCHGGVLFSLADTVMGHASNAGNERSVATTASIEWVKAARIGDRLIATSRTVATRGRNTVHDVDVVNQTGETIAIFRGQTLTLGGSVVEPPEARPDA